MLKDVLFIITRSTEPTEWQDTWNFDMEENVAFIDYCNCSTKYACPTLPAAVPLVIIRGDSKQDVISAVLNLSTDRKIWLLIHSAGNMRGFLAVNQGFISRIPPENENEDKVNNWLKLLKLACLYSTGGGEPQLTLGKEVESLVNSVRDKEPQKLSETLSGLLDAYEKCSGVDKEEITAAQIMRKTQEVASELIKSKVPWLYEYFLELSQRLLALNDDNKAVVKKIIFGEGAQEGESYEQRCTPNNERDVEVIVDNVKCKKKEHEVFRDIQNWVSELLKDENCKNKHLLNGGQEYTRLYSNIYNCLEALCRNEKEKILGKEKYSST